jgi:hypothetical protein
MNDEDRFKLLHGPYHAPPVKRGDVVFCEARGDVLVAGETAAPIPWPVGKKGRAKAPILFGGLVDAVKKESNQAVAYWWGVTPQTVTKWRKALDVPRANEGTHRLHHDVALEPGVAAGREKAHAKSREPGADTTRRQKIAAARQGKPRRDGMMEALAEANRGRALDEETRRKMSEAHRRRGTWPPAAGRSWTAEEDELVRNLPAKEVAERTGRTLAAVYERRIDLRMPDGRRRENKG